MNSMHKAMKDFIIEIYCEKEKKKNRVRYIYTRDYS